MLEQAFKILGYETKGRTCEGIKGIVEEGEGEIKLGRDKPTFAADLALITVVQKVEHYEISGYGSVRTMAEQTDNQDLAALLRQTEDEEKMADSLLTEAARSLLAMSA